MIKTFTGIEGSRDSDGELLYGIIIRNTIRQQNITVTTTVVKLPTTPLSKRISLEIFNNSTSGQILYVGDSTVNSTNGRPIYPRSSYLIAIEDDVDIYGIASASGADIRIVEGA